MIRKITRGVKVSCGEVNCGDMRIVAVERVKNLGSVLTAENEVEAEVVERIAAATRYFWALSPLLSSRELSRGTKVQVYCTTVRPSVLYGCEAWRFTKKLGSSLEVFENGILRRLCRPVWHHIGSLYHIVRKCKHPNFAGDLLPYGATCGLCNIYVMYPGSFTYCGGPGSTCDPIAE